MTETRGDRGDGPGEAPGALGAREESDRVGTVVCGWTIERLLGTGAVGASWLGARAGSEDAVVRVLREPFAGDERARAEWLGASWAANRFYHPRVPKVMQDGIDDRGAAVVVRAWAKGRPLDQVMRAGPIDLPQALRLAEQLLDALEMAHAHGIVHGALTPSNVIVTSRGSMRLVDFATTPGLLARPADALSRARAQATAFVAPERRGPTLLAATQQSDVWSVGACLHFALAGVPPRAEAPSLERAAPDAQGDLVAVVDRALAADPIDRYESAYAMLGDIRCLVAGRKPRLQGALVAVPSQGTASMPPPAPAAGVTGVTGAAGAAVVTGAPGETDAPLQALEPGTDAEFAAAMPLGLRPAPRPRGSEWRGNVVLIATIAFIVAFATFVMVRERQADRPRDVTTAPTAEAIQAR